MAWDDELPGYTCPAIDKQIAKLKQWSSYPSEFGDTVLVIDLDSALEAFEQLRQENEKLRYIAEERLDAIRERQATLDKIGELL